MVIKSEQVFKLQPIHFLVSNHYFDHVELKRKLCCYLIEIWDGKPPLKGMVALNHIPNDSSVSWILRARQPCVISVDIPQ